MKFLVIEDDLLSRLSLENYLKSKGSVVSACNSKEANKLIDNDSQINLAFVDLDLESELMGLSLVSRLSEQSNAYIVVLSGREDDETIKEAYLRGANDYLCKPFDAKHLDKLLKKVSFKEKSDCDKSFISSQFLTTCPELKKSINDAFCFSIENGNLLVLGESGTGKTKLIKLIHKAKGLDSKKLIHINCSGLNADLLESELFGHEKGAFTGASEQKIGKLELADKGTLFLDEIATMPMATQEKLLIALEEKSFYRLGGKEEINVDFQIIAATCEDLIEQVKLGDFRKDLYFRLAAKTICLPGLRHRKEDISILFNSLVSKSHRRVILKEDAQTILEEYSWPGNIRELKQISEQLVNSGHGIIGAQEISQIIKENSFSLLGSDSNEKETNDNSFNFNLERVKELGLKRIIEDIENKIVTECLALNDHKVRKTLDTLKVSNSTFYKIIERTKKSGELGEIG